MKSNHTIRYEQLLPEVMHGFASAQATIDAAGLDRPLHHLIMLRASQVNGCAFCVKMHTREAREDGETNERLDRLVVWRHVGDFTPREKAALAWTEAMTRLDDQDLLSDLRGGLREHFNERQIAVLGATVAMINLWNRIAISNH